jgi:hypothetical protein
LAKRLLEVKPARVRQVFRDTMTPKQVGPIQARSLVFTTGRQLACDPQLLRCGTAWAVQEHFRQLFAARSFPRAVAALLLLVAAAGAVAGGAVVTVASQIGDVSPVPNRAPEDGLQLLSPRRTEFFDVPSRAATAL